MESNTKYFTSLIRLDREYDGFTEAMKTSLTGAKPLPVVVNGLTGGGQTAFLCEAVRDARVMTEAPVLILVGSDEEREKTATALQNAGINALAFRPRELVFSNICASRDAERERLSVLSAILAGEADAVVTTPAAAMLNTVPREVLASLCEVCRSGDILEPKTLVERLSLLGFSRTDTVDGAGQFAQRGGIVDFFPDAGEEPIRVEFFGDEIDRITHFDPISQRSTSPCEEVRLLPAAEVLISEKAKARILYAIEKLMAKAEDTQILSTLSAEKNILEQGMTADFRDKYLGLIYDTQENLLSYFSSDSSRRVCVFLLGTSGVRENAKLFAERMQEEAKTFLDRGLVTKEAVQYGSDTDALEGFLSENSAVHINPFSGGLGSIRVAGLFGFRMRRTTSYGENAAMLIEDIENFRKTGYRIILACENKQGEQSLLSSLADAGIAAAKLPENVNFSIEKAPSGSVFTAVSDADGFDLMTPRVALLSMKRDEGRAVMARRRQQRILRKSGAGERIMSYADLSVGDYVVHANYGIGLFEGISTVRIDGVSRDYITIRYAGTDKLFVPCDRIEMIAKYIGAHAEDGTVKLSKMGGGDWNKAKSKAKAAVQDIAKKLIALYAERQRKPGFAFPAECEMEREFADAFPYEPTSCQLDAMEDIRRDMQKPIPMNRLLCGDVGYGKTEVALRAAFKAILGGKQVAILVPTTILAMQHYQTSLSRMRGYPVNVAMLSRFCTAKEKEQILRKVKRGEVDLLIGTHALLSKNVEFSDLGLLIIDEEQRFGVVQKEKLKEMAKNVDVLSMTATPIPRTLNMAMTGISDISVLDEAPGDRHPVQTYVLEYDENVLSDAMQKELFRHGQVLYLCNRIEEIEYCADKISKALPMARVAVAHGQMEKEEIEDIWQNLVRGDIDILVCTTIIETGVDLPNANTLIIENADRMGLSQLHQIRGRVGRSARQAYAYFTYRAGKVLSEVAEKRLSAIREFAEFGAGFKIALRDLEIRGAGNLLGPEQHGYIESVGYDLYVRLLNEAVLEESGVPKKEEFESAVDIKLDANIPETYISAGAQRMEMYKKISLIRTPEDLSDVTDEFLDRFGDMPRATSRLISISLIRALASNAEIRRVAYEGGILSFYTDKPDLSVWSEIVLTHPGIEIRSYPTVSVRWRSKTADAAIDTALDILKIYAEVVKKKKASAKKEETGIERS